MVQDNSLLKTVLIGYFLFLLVSCFLISPFRDTFYYWDWSRHLSLSYFDGPPLIAYAIRLFTLLFGNSLFALNFLGVVCVVLTSFIIYKILGLFSSKETGLLAAALYFTAPFVNQQLLSKVSYDNLLNLFWPLSLYFAVRYIKAEKISDIYKFAVAAGLMLLSQYDGIVLLAALLVYFICSKKQRAIFSKLHFYLGLLIILAIFSPVLLWNAEHSWVSFKYQLVIHRMGVVGYSNGAPVYGPKAPQLLQHIANLVHYLWALLLNFNIIFLTALLGWVNLPRSSELRCIKWLAIFLVIFWASLSVFSNIAANYSLPLFGMLLILSVPFFVRHVKLSALIIAVFLIIDTVATVSHIEGLSFNSREDNYILAKQAALIYEKNPQAVITPHYVAAEQIAYWLKGRPQVYVLSCGLDANQYRFWQENFMGQLKEHQIKQALFLDYMNEPDCIAPYFKQCTEQAALMYKKSKLYVYQCVN